MHRALTLLGLSLFALTFFVVTQVEALDTDGLGGAWLFDEDKGETVTDSSDNGLDGKIAKGEPKWVDGKFGGASEQEINELMEDGMIVALDVQPSGKLATTWSQIKTQ